MSKRPILFSKQRMSAQEARDLAAGIEKEVKAEAKASDYQAVDGIEIMSAGVKAVMSALDEMTEVLKDINQNLSILVERLSDS